MPENAPVISILIVAFNSRPFIEHCLASVSHACGDLPHEVLLIDNGLDGTEAFVRERFPKVRIIASRGNVGFGQANNILAAHADPDSRFLVLVNPDVRLESGAIAALVRAADTHPDYVALGGQMQTPDGSPSAASIVRLPTVWRMTLGAIGIANWANARSLADPAQQEVQRVEAISGGFLLLRPEDWKRLGGFDETYFLYGEDIDLCHRIGLLNGKIGLVPSARVHHDVGSGDFYSPARTRYKVTANAHFANQHFGPVKRRAFKAALWIRCWIRWLLGLLLGRLPSQKALRLRALGNAFRLPAVNPASWVHGFDSEGSDPRRATSRGEF
ncbi:MAG: glycosyltransferase family 2 protein [Pseudomonadota bacterium]